MQMESRQIRVAYTYILTSCTYFIYWLLLTYVHEQISKEDHKKNRRKSRYTKQTTHHVGNDDTVYTEPQSMNVLKVTTFKAIVLFFYIVSDQFFIPVHF